MAKKKEETTVEETLETPATEETAVQTDSDEVEAKPKKKAKKAAETDASAEDGSVIEGVLETAAGIVEDVVEAVAEGVDQVVQAVTGDTSGEVKKQSKRAEKVGIVWSDKMTKTVVVRVDRQVKHPIYRKYIKRKKKFMAHDETGATIGDKVRIVETRPLSARKRWRVVEIIQKAEK